MLLSAHILAIAHSLLRIMNSCCCALHLYLMHVHPFQHKSVAGVFPGFVLNIVLNGTVVEFEPSPSGFDVVVLNPFHRIVDAACSIPRVETKLFPNESEHASKPNLSPVVAQETVENAMLQVLLQHACCTHRKLHRYYIVELIINDQVTAAWFVCAIRYAY